MAWKIEIDPAAERELDRLDGQVARRILRFLSERLSGSQDPRSLGEARRGSRLGEFWKYRVGDYRVVSRIEDERLLVLVVTVGHRSRVYRR
ncbi:type II toxin-antitoxin system RelE/ParE family toxin [Thiocapsa sp.]|uniref:type II toxin-antitoxin system RelE family toxin n=1 Tax=Thiocapsa sp. TaxID=2024551 RepID=UPI002C1DA849|nr:type II toxin-antitoxin system RelE/ParE family toxin [Thiocapsa sp.]HSO83547.1 type II toxin-antitoxin system RelE/ParE family toxin [Thiocapsa sp.]